MTSLLQEKKGQQGGWELSLGQSQRHPSKPLSAGNSTELWGQ